MSKPRDRGGLAWGNATASALLIVLLVALVVYEIVQLRRHPLDPLPMPVNRITGAPQQPNGAVITVTAAQ